MSMEDVGYPYFHVGYDLTVKELSECDQNYIFSRVQYTDAIAISKPEQIKFSYIVCGTPDISDDQLAGNKTMESVLKCKHVNIRDFVLAGSKLPSHADLTILSAMTVYLNGLEATLDEDYIIDRTNRILVVRWALIKPTDIISYLIPVAEGGS